MTKTIKTPEKLRENLSENLDINNIVNKLASEKFVENIVYKINRNEDPENLEDLIQDIYLQMLTKNSQQILTLFSKNQLNYYITRIVMNNIASNTSQYHRLYRRNNKHISFDNLLNNDINLLGQETEWTRI